MDILAHLYPIVVANRGYNIQVGEDEARYLHTIIFKNANGFIELYYVGDDDPSPSINIPASICKYICLIHIDDYSDNKLLHFMIKRMYIYCRRIIYAHKFREFEKLDPYGYPDIVSERTKRIEKLILFFMQNRNAVTEI